MYNSYIHVIWTTYMTWPPGDDRGHWSPLFDLYGKLKEAGHRLNPPDRVTRTQAAGLAKEPPRILSESDQEIVGETIGDVLANAMKPGTRIHAAAIEPTHVHLLFAPMNDSIDRIVGIIKGRTSSDVIARGNEPGRRRTWTAGFWKVFLDRDVPIHTVIGYIEEHNVRRGLPAVRFAWVTPLEG